MAEIYGHAWVSQFGESDSGTWFLALRHLTPQELAAGLEKCLDRDSGFPPGLGEFRRLCRPKLYPYRERHLALPHEADIGTGEAALTVMRKTLNRGDGYEEKKETIDPGSDPEADDVGQVVDDPAAAGDAETETPAAPNGDHGLSQDKGSQEK